MCKQRLCPELHETRDEASRDFMSRDSVAASIWAAAALRPPGSPCRASRESALW